MYSTPRWALPFAAQCRLRLKLADAGASLTPDLRASARLMRELRAHRSQAAWHVACWVHRRERGTA